MNGSGVRWRGDRGVVRVGTGMVVCVSVYVFVVVVDVQKMVYIEKRQVTDKISIRRIPITNPRFAGRVIILIIHCGSVLVGFSMFN